MKKTINGLEFDFTNYSFDDRCGVIKVFDPDHISVDEIIALLYWDHRNLICILEIERIEKRKTKTREYLIKNGKFCIKYSAGKTGSWRGVKRYILDQISLDCK